MVNTSSAYTPVAYTILESVEKGIKKDEGRDIKLKSDTPGIVERTDEEKEAYYDSIVRARRDKDKKDSKVKQEKSTTSVSPVMMEQEDVIQESPLSRIKTVKTSSTSTPISSTLISAVEPGLIKKEPTLSDLQTQRQESVSRLQRFYTTKRTYDNIGGTQTGTEQVLKPEVSESGFSVFGRRLFKSKEAKEYESEVGRLKDIESQIYAKTTAVDISKTIDIKKLPEGSIKRTQRMETYVPETSTLEQKYRELEKTRLEKETTAQQIPRSTGIIEAGILYGTSQLGIGEQAPATKVLSLSAKEQSLRKELESEPVIFGETRTQTSERLQNAISLDTTKLGTTDISRLETDRKTPERIAKESLIMGAAEDVAVTALTAGISVGATKLAAKSPLAFKAVKGIDVIDNISDIYELGTGTFNLLTGNAPGAARNIGNIVVGNVAAGKASQRIGSKLDFGPVAETKLEQRLFPKGIPIDVKGYDVELETREPNLQERRIAQELPLLSKEKRSSLVSDGPEFQDVFIETKPSLEQSMIRELDQPLGSSTEVREFGYSSRDIGPSFSSERGETIITRPTTKTERLTGVFKEGGEYKQLRSNIPRERVESFIGEQKRTFRQMLASKKGTISQSRPSVLTSLDVASTPSERLSIGLGIEPDIKLKTKFTPSVGSRSRLSLTQKTRTFKTPDLVSTPKPDVILDLKPDLEPVTKTGVLYDTDITSNIDTSTTYTSEVRSDITTTPKFTPTLTPKITTSFTPRSLPFRIPRGASDLRGRSKKVREFSVENKILDITKGFKRTKGITGKESTFNGKLKPIKKSEISEKLKRFL